MKIVKVIKKKDENKNCQILLLKSLQACEQTQINEPQESLSYEETILNNLKHDCDFGEKNWICTTRVDIQREVWLDIQFSVDQHVWILKFWKKYWKRLNII